MFGLVGVDEDEVERARPLRLEPGSVSSAGPTRTSTKLAVPGPLDAPPRHFGVFRVDFQRDQPAPRGHPPRQPDRAVAADVPNSSTCRAPTSRARIVSSSSLRRRDLDRPHPRRLGIGDRRPQHLVVGRERRLDERVDRLEGLLVDRQNTVAILGRSGSCPSRGYERRRARAAGQLLGQRHDLLEGRPVLERERAECRCRRSPSAGSGRSRPAAGWRRSRRCRRRRAAPG